MKGGLFSVCWLQTDVSRLLSRGSELQDEKTESQKEPDWASQASEAMLMNGASF